MFKPLFSAAGANGSLAADAWFAAMALESGCERVTADRDHARFTGLETSHPLH